MHNSGFRYNPKTNICYRTLAFLGFPLYRVSWDGVVWTKHNNRWGQRKKWKRMKIKVRPDGSCWVNLYRIKHKPEGFAIAHLVMYAFWGPRPKNYFVCHKDDIKGHNDILNLYYGTHMDNVRDAMRNKRLQLGEDRYNASLTNAQILQIRELEKSGYSRRRIAEKIGIRIGTIHKILTWEIYKSVY